MAVEITGSVYNSTAQNSTNNNLSVSVPTDADMCVVIGMSYADSNLGMDVLCWDAGATNDFTAIAANSQTDGASRVNAVIASYMLSGNSNWPGSGSKTLQFSYSGTPTYGTVTVCFFLKGVATTGTIIGTDTEDTDTVETWTNTSVGTVGTADMCIIAGSGYGTPAVTAVGNSQTNIYVLASGNSHAIASKLNDSTLEAVHAQYFGGVAFGVLASTTTLSISVHDCAETITCLT